MLSTSTATSATTHGQEHKYFRCRLLFLQEEKMKVTLLIAMCTLVLLQQMQTPMANPLQIEPTYTLLRESILLFYSMRTDQQTLIHFQCIPMNRHRKSNVYRLVLFDFLGFFCMKTLSHNYYNEIELLHVAF